MKLFHRFIETLSRNYKFFVLFIEWYYLFNTSGMALQKYYDHCVEMGPLTYNSKGSQLKMSICIPFARYSISSPSLLLLSCC